MHTMATCGNSGSNVPYAGSISKAKSSAAVEVERTWSSDVPGPSGTDWDAGLQGSNAISAGEAFLALSIQSLAML